jgi:hypothetical protein
VHALKDSCKLQELESEAEAHQLYAEYYFRAARSTCVRNRTSRLGQKENEKNTSNNHGQLRAQTMHICISLHQ